MNLKIIFLCINTVTAAAHNHLRHKPEQNHITSFQNTKGELSRLLLLKGSETERLLSKNDLGSCDKDKDCKGDNQKCKSSSQEDEEGECECEKGYKVVKGECVPKEDAGGSGEAGGQAATAKVLTTEEEEELECLKDGAKDALKEDDENDVEDNLDDLVSLPEPDGCGITEEPQLTCVKDCNAEIVDDCKSDLKNSGSNSNPSHDYDDCKHLENDLKHCYEDCYE